MEFPASDLFDSGNWEILDDASNLKPDHQIEIRQSPNVAAERVVTVLKFEIN